MEKTTVSISFEKEKLDAMTVFLSEENSTVQKKLEEDLQRLYEETVPEEVRKFVEARSSTRPRRSAAKPRPAVKPNPAAQKEVSEHEQP